MRKNSLKVLRKHNKKTAPSDPGPLLNRPTKPRNGSKTLLSESKKPKTEKTNSTEKSNWKDDQELDVILQLGIDFRNQGNNQAAIQSFEKAIRRSPRCSYAYWLLGGIHYVYLNDPKTAIPFFQEAVKLSPKTEKASLGLFHCLWDTDQVYDALEEIKRYQLLTNWSCQDYLEIMDEIKEKWQDSPKPKKRLKTRK